MENQFFNSDEKISLRFENTTEKDMIKNFMHGPPNVQLYTEIMTDEFNFFHFGCWNRDGCMDQSYLQKVVDALNGFNLSFGVIAGDNVYYRKIEKDGEIHKFYDRTILDKGIECLERLDIPLFACLGNHDVEKCNITEDEVSRTQIYIKNAELHINLSNSKWILPHNYYDLIIKTPTKRIHFIFIETNLFTMDKDCYDEKKERLKEMLLWVEKTLKTPSDEIFIVGHVFLFGFKKKGDRDIYVELPGIEKLLNILKKSKRKHFKYLCADIHNFQHIIFRGEGEYADLIIDNITAGVGGGSPDDLPINDHIDVELIMDDITIGNLNLTAKDNPYGFVLYQFNSGGLEVEYRKVIDKTEFI